MGGASHNTHQTSAYQGIAPPRQAKGGQRLTDATARDRRYAPGAHAVDKQVLHSMSFFPSPVPPFLQRHTSACTPYSPWPPHIPPTRSSQSARRLSRASGSSSQFLFSHFAFETAHATGFSALPAFSPLPLRSCRTMFLGDASRPFGTLSRSLTSMG